MSYGYVIANIQVTDPVQIEEYRQWSTAAVQACGGEFIVRGGQQQVQEGAAHPRTVVLRFPTYAQAQAFYDSPEYRKAREHRAGAAIFDMLCVEGV
ncbi:DUF1330 domain-containing protein [Ottowia testudinis]|uniref:DUF1330 domain-containing protein n=1 Tax=Ottowia testudinis TaxID=2816950 RepID=A0A975CJ01_9BURK|nr:DUF1330 domain-containing protein [Ottowia testudinis]QTD47065.1 DUF1330 domain-containing protein [Ottowia testudinis]